MQLESSNIDRLNVRQFRVPVHTVVCCRRNKRLRYRVVPRDASYELRKSFLFIRGHLDFRLPRDCPMERRTLEVMAELHSQNFKGTPRHFNRGRLQVFMEA